MKKYFQPSTQQFTVVMQTLMDSPIVEGIAGNEWAEKGLNVE